jgi:ERF superfamily
MSMSDTINDLAAALAKAQAQLKPAIKEATNPHLKSKYADLRAIWEACRDALATNGLSVVQLPSDTEEPGRVALTTVLLHTSGQYISSTFSTRLAQENAQGVGSALTYLRRYGLSSMVGIIADEDDDGHSASASQGKQQTAQTAPVTTEPRTNGAPKASEPQIKKLFAIWKGAGYEGTLKEWIKAEYECEIDALTMKDASAAIEFLQPKDDKPGVVSKTAELPV